MQLLRDYQSDRVSPRFRVYATFLMHDTMILVELQSKAIDKGAWGGGGGGLIITTVSIMPPNISHYGLAFAVISHPFL